MVLSYYLVKIPYSLIYRILKFFRKPKKVVFYCPYMLDQKIFEPIAKYLKQIPVASPDPKIRSYFKERGFKVYSLPVFPKAVIMCRHSCHKFPEKEIIKIGCNHHAYHFKKLTGADNYNMFDVYLMNSRANLKAAENIGVTTAKAIGFPKLDPAFDNQISEDKLEKLKSAIGINPRKKTILFTSTWVESGMSALHKWQSRLNELTSDFNVLVTLHPWIKKHDRKIVAENEGVYLIPDEYTLPYIMISDFCIGDTSTILCECSALNKPLITFNTPKAKRSLESTYKILADISIRINDFEEIIPAIKKYYDNPGYKEENRENANKFMFDELDGKAGLRAANEIIKLLPELKNNSNYKLE